MPGDLFARLVAIAPKHGLLERGSDGYYKDAPAAPPPGEQPSVQRADWECRVRSAAVEALAVIREHQYETAKMEGKDTSSEAFADVSQALQPRLVSADQRRSQTEDDTDAQEAVNRAKLMMIDKLERRVRFDQAHKRGVFERLVLHDEDPIPLGDYSREMTGDPTALEEYDRIWRNPSVIDGDMRLGKTPKSCLKASLSIVCGWSVMMMVAPKKIAAVRDLLDRQAGLGWYNPGTRLSVTHTLPAEHTPDITLKGKKISIVPRVHPNAPHMWIYSLNESGDVACVMEALRDVMDANAETTDPNKLLAVCVMMDECQTIMNALAPHQPRTVNAKTHAGEGADGEARRARLQHAYVM